MILQHKRDRESWYREKTIESLKSNTYLLENDIVLVAETNCFYKVIKTTTDIPLQNNLFAEVMTSNIVGNSTSADKLKTPRTISLTGDISGSTSFDGSENVTIDSTIADDSHTHSNSTITSLDASKINTGVLNSDVLPILDASKIGSGVIDIARLPAAALERLVEVENDIARFELTKEQIQLGDVVKVKDTLKMYKIIDDNNLNNENGYSVFVAGRAAEVPWSGVTDKPNDYPPSSHTHTKGQITDFPTSLKNPTAITIQTNGTSLGSYDGSVAKTFDITASNIGSYTKDEIEEKLKNVNVKTGDGIYNENNTIKLVSDNDGIVINKNSIELNVVNDLITGGIKKPLSAEQGKVLKSLFDSIENGGTGSLIGDEERIKKYKYNGTLSSNSTEINVGKVLFEPSLFLVQIGVAFKSRMLRIL